MLDVPWERLLDELDRRGVAVTLAWGSRDELGDRELGRRLIEGTRHDVRTVAGAGHDLPAARPVECRRMVVV